MSYQKLANLVRSLRRQTNKGEIDWEETAVKGTFQATFGSHALQISSVNPGGGGEQDIMIVVFDEDGNPIESMRDPELAQFFGSEVESWKLMNEIYQTARRQSLGTERAIDSILNILNEDEPPF